MKLKKTRSSTLSNSLSQKLQILPRLKRSASPFSKNKVFKGSELLHKVLTQLF
jgi:hypothetical protein